MVEKTNVEQIAITDERVKRALHLIRVVFAEWMIQEFPLRGDDCLHILAAQGLCSQAEADAASAEAMKQCFKPLRGIAENRNPWDRDVADKLGEMYTCWSTQYCKPCVVAYFDLGDADKIIAHCKHMGAAVREGGNSAYVVVLRADVGPELYSEEAIRRGAELHNLSRWRKAVDVSLDTPIRYDQSDDESMGGDLGGLPEHLLRGIPQPNAVIVHPCTECGDPTTFACADCAIDGNPGLHICPNQACMAAHESKCHA